MEGNGINKSERVNGDEDVGRQRRVVVEVRVAEAVRHLWRPTPKRLTVADHLLQRNGFGDVKETIIGAGGLISEERYRREKSAKRVMATMGMKRRMGRV